MHTIFFQPFLFSFFSLSHLNLFEFFEFSNFQIPGKLDKKNEPNLKSNQIRMHIIKVCSILLVTHSSLSVTASSLRANAAVCYDILDSWWKERHVQINHGIANQWDSTCSKFNGIPSVCNIRGPSRKIAYSSVFSNGTLTDTEAITPCNMLGAHSPVCAGNICNHYNTGSCTLQETGGLCNWVTKENAVRFNLEYGCQRNPCHLGGMGGVSDATCIARGVPGFAACTYCKGPGDPQLEGEGMGCQQIVLTTTAVCAPVNNKIVPKSTIWWKIADKRCQCSDDSLVCQSAMSVQDNTYKKRY